jgi:hypothetical protein
VTPRSHPAAGELQRRWRATTVGSFASPICPCCRQQKMDCSLHIVEARQIEVCLPEISLAIDRSARTIGPSSRSPRAQAAHGVVTFHYLFSTHPPARGGKLISLSFYNASFFLFSRARTYGINAPIVYLQKKHSSFLPSYLSSISLSLSSLPTFHAYNRVTWCKKLCI